MNNKFILLSAVTPADFSLETVEELREAAQEWGCDIIESKDTMSNPVYFFTAPKLTTLQRMCTETELPGIAVEVNSVFDQYVEA